MSDWYPWRNKRCTFSGARVTKIAEPVDVSKPAECRNYSLRCTLCPSFLCYPFSFSPSADLSPIFRVPLHLSSRPVRPFLVLFRHALSASGHHPRPSVSRLPSCDTPNLYALILVHTDSGYLRERVYFWQRLPCIMPPQSLFPSIPVPFARDRSFAPYNCDLRVTRFIFQVSRPRLREDVRVPSG